MGISTKELKSIVNELSSKPGHEKVRFLVSQLLTNELEIPSTSITFEQNTKLQEINGRIDSLLGQTIFEFKSDLRREKSAAEEQLTRYIQERQQSTNQRYVGIATDGKEFMSYKIQNGLLIELNKTQSNSENPESLIQWLNSIISIKSDLLPTPDIIKRELGSTSMAWLVAKEEFKELWNELKLVPEVALKYSLWSKLMEYVYGLTIDSEDLFLQHTYLSTLAKTIASNILEINTSEPKEIISGSKLRELGILGVVEEDFFDWYLKSKNGDNLIKQIYNQASRFRLSEIKNDVLKGLYESLIDPEQRHLLGEYYTPDWLAEKICDEQIDQPLDQRILDPACGSGTFLFYAIQKLLKATENNGLDSTDIIKKITDQIYGFDIHPVAVQFARVTYLLALGKNRLQNKTDQITIPVYMGDALQTNTEAILTGTEVYIEVPDENKRLEFPHEVAADPYVFDDIINHMLELSQQNAATEGLLNWLQRIYGNLESSTINILVKTYEFLRDLQEEGRNHIWGFVARNLIRPVWLSRDDQKVDILIGNPPWLTYSNMNETQKRRFMDACKHLDLWVPGVSPHMDLSSYFYIRSMELYLKATGKIAFVMPYATTTRRQFSKFRSGKYGKPTKLTAQFTSVWGFETLNPLFPVPSSVFFAKFGSDIGLPFPTKIIMGSGNLTGRDLSYKESRDQIDWNEIPMPPAFSGRTKGGYADKFEEGAAFIPRLFFRVKYEENLTIGRNASRPLVQSERSNQEKTPWKTLDPLSGNIEKEFLREMYLAESIGPYTLLKPSLAVVPLDPNTQEIMNSKDAQIKGYPYLSKWLNDAESLWKSYGKDEKRSISDQLNYYKHLTNQFPIPSIRIAYKKSGSDPLAIMIKDSNAVIDQTLYWTGVKNETEGFYLLGILNSKALQKAIENRQSKGQFGARHFDKVVFSLETPPPIFNEYNKLHTKIAELAQYAQTIISSSQLDKNLSIQRLRNNIRIVLEQDGVANQIDELVKDLLNL